MRTVHFQKSDVDRAKDFARQVLATQDKRDFATAITRTEQKILEDTVAGKLAEMAVQVYFARKYDWHVELDFDIYEGGDDGYDFKPSKLRVDVKATQRNSMWLLDFQYKADAFISVKSCLPRHKDWLRHDEAAVVVEGYACAEDLVHEFEAGEYLFHPIDKRPLVKLKAKNRGIPIKDLKRSRGDWMLLKGRCT